MILWYTRMSTKKIVRMTNRKSPKLKQRVYGPIISDNCDACGKDSVWLLSKTAREYTFMGTAVFTWNTEYSMLCMLCGYGIGLHKSLFDKLKPIAVKNAPQHNTEAVAHS